MSNAMNEEYISPTDLHSQFNGPETPLIIDVRGEEEYRAGHVLGAVHIPGDDLARKLDEIDINRPVVTYCNMQHRGSSRGERAAQLLREKGYAAKALEGGFPAWADADYPTATGEDIPE